MKRKFSIIIPVYKVEAYLKECLDSVLAQTFTDYEVICIDDGSPDRCGEILDEYAVRVGVNSEETLNSNFTVIHQSNAGVAAARNAGLKEAKGEYICFLDADDKVRPDWLEKYAWEIARHHPSIVCINHSDLMLDGSIKRYPELGGNLYFQKQDDASEWAWHHFPTRGFVCGYAVRRDIVDKKRFPDGIKYAEDALFILSVLRRVESLSVIPYDGYCYRQRSDSAVRIFFDYQERKRFVDAWKRIRAEIEGQIPAADVRWTAIREGEQQLLNATFFAWLSRPAAPLRKGSGLEALRELAQMIDPKIVKPRWRALFRLFQKTGSLFPLRVAHDFAVSVARRRV